MMLERIQKIISRAGIASRRHAEQLILSGAVTVNGQVITELGTKADADRDHITVGPRVVRLEAQAPGRYLAFNKPPQVVSTLNDPEGRPCLGPYLRTNKGRLFPVGRLEFDAGGLLLLTSDGELASDLMRAAGAISQTWRFKVKGRISETTRQAIERGSHARLNTYRDAANAWYEATLRNATRDLLRQTLQRQGVLLEKMVRSGFAGIELGSLPTGEMRELSPAEVNTLRRAAQGRAEPVAPPRDVAARPAPPRRRPARREGVAGAASAWRDARRRGRPGRPHGSARPPRDREASRFARTPRSAGRGHRRHAPEGQTTA
jgi:23S rRNA pseudouridine2605 synthase